MPSWKNLYDMSIRLESWGANASLVAFILESDCSVCHGDANGIRRTGLLRDVAIKQSLTDAYGSMEIQRYDCGLVAFDP